MAERKHTVFKVFPATFKKGDGAGTEPDSTEFMLFGTVDYVLRTGVMKNVSWAGHAVVARSSDTGPWKFTYYRVYLQH